MKKFVSMIITDIITTIYDSFGLSLFLSTLFILLYMLVAQMRKPDKNTSPFSHTGKKRKADLFFIKLFLLAFYISMVLYRTLLGRNPWPDPLSNVMGGWWIWESNRNGVIVLTTKCFENLMLMFPFTVLLLWVAEKRLTGKEDKVKIGKILCLSLKAAFIFSITIELLQLFFRLGTFQISDICYNTAGGGIGGLAYWIGRQVIKK